EPGLGAFAGAVRVVDARRFDHFAEEGGAFGSQRFIDATQLLALLMRTGCPDLQLRHLAAQLNLTLGRPGQVLLEPFALCACRAEVVLQLLGSSFEVNDLFESTL